VVISRAQEGIKICMACVAIRRNVIGLRNRKVRRRVVTDDTWVSSHHSGFTCGAAVASKTIAGYARVACIAHLPAGKSGGVGVA
jgi:hypothetical protein